MENKIILNFHLFDGEGGGDGGADASSSDVKQDVKTIQYGRSEGEAQTRSQVGTDNGAESLDAEWKALTGKGGRFHDLYGQGVSNAIQERFKNQADLQGQVNQISEDLSPLFMNYGLSAGDFEGLKNAIAHDDAFYKAGAEREGLDVEQYKQKLKLQADAERGRKITEAYERQQKANEMYAQWESDAADLQQAFPNFDLGKEIENNDMFSKLLDTGVDVRTAFLTTHMDEIMNGSNTYAQQVATQNVISTIQQRASRPMEGALSHSPAIQRKSDPSTLSGEDIDEINRRVAMGEQVSF